MTSSPWFRRFAFAYGTAFAILYVIAFKLDFALFTIYPRIGAVLLGTHHSRDTVARDALVRLDRHGRARSAGIRPRRRILARALLATVLVWVVLMGESRGSDDWVAAILSYDHTS